MCAIFLGKEERIYNPQTISCSQSTKSNPKRKIKIDTGPSKFLDVLSVSFALNYEHKKMFSNFYWWQLIDFNLFPFRIKDVSCAYIQVSKTVFKIFIV